MRNHTPTRPGTHTNARAHTQKYAMFIAIPQQQWFANAPQYYVIRALSVLFNYAEYARFAHTILAYSI
jgi:hypothetical protein